MQGELLKAEKIGDALKIVAILQGVPMLLDKVVQLAGKEVSITVSEIKEKRSLDANAYLWLIIGKIADKLRTSKEEVYKIMLERYGQGFTVTVRDYVDMNKTGIKYWKKIEEGDIKGKKYIAYRVFRGSSTYTQEEFSVLIDGVKQEANDLGISTDLDDYVDFMV